MTARLIAVNLIKALTIVHYDSRGEQGSYSSHNVQPNSCNLRLQRLHKIGHSYLLNFNPYLPTVKLMDTLEIMRVI